LKRVITVSGSPSHASPEETDPYAEALLVAGIEPVIVQPGQAASLDSVAGLMLMGGSDVNPAAYGAERHPETDAPDELRDELELRLIAEALERDLPILAICRGLQILNVQHGGTLVQHLEPVERHRRRTKDPSLTAHPIEIERGSVLGRIAQDVFRWDVNSRHHQAVARPGMGLRVSARHPDDGVIEAVERPDKRFVMAVQWHPENQSAAREEQARLFRAFAEALL
jgi:gamma-glutamyl-gamma-aminobutyrate hydrolase PuuD